MHIDNSFKMRDEEIMSAIKSSLKALVKDKNLSISAEMKIIEDLGLESIDFIDLVFELEKKFRIEIDLNLLALELAKFKERRFTEVRIVDLYEFIVKTLVAV